MVARRVNQERIIKLTLYNMARIQEDVEEYYQSQGKEIVDSLFNKKVFNQDLTRDDLQSIENLIAFYFQSHANSVKKCAEIKLKFNKQ